MSASIQWTGLQELRANLRKLPEEFAIKAVPIVEGRAQAAAADIRAAYPRSNNPDAKHLADSVLVGIKAAGKFGAAAFVRNIAPHAFIFEHGTAARNFNGANRGTMPPGNVFIPIVMRHRRQMYHELAALVREAGLQVTGLAA